MKKPLILLVLLVGLITATVLVQQPQNFFHKALTSSVKFTLNPGTQSLKPSERFAMDIILSPEGNPVSAVELSIEYQPQYLSVRPEDIVIGSLLPTHLGITKIEQIDQTKNRLKITFGASCTELGCNPALTSGKLVTVYFTGLNSSGSTKVNLGSSTKIASASDINANSTGLLFSANEVLVSFSSVTPTPTTQPEPSNTPVPSPSPTEPPIQANQILKPISDAHVKEAYPSSNYSLENYLTASNYEENSKQIAYLKYDLSQISGNLIKAQLKLTPRLTRDVTKTIHLIPDITWTEETLTWNNKPPIGASIGYFADHAQTDIPIWVELDVVELNNYIGKVISLGIGNGLEDNNTLSIYSREFLDKEPELYLEVQQVIQPIAIYTLSTKDDAYVQSYTGRENNNYGSSTTLISSSYYDSNTRLAYLKFDGAQIIGKSIISAKLVITPSLSRTVEKEIRSVTDNAWTESSLTYVNRPPAGNVMGKISYLDQALNINQNITIDLTPSEISVSPSGEISIAIINTSKSNTLEIYSKEASTNSYQPKLIIEAR